MLQTETTIDFEAEENACEPKPTEREQFCIDSDEKADWLLAKYAAIDAEISLINEQTTAMLARLTSERRGLENRFHAELEHYMAGRLEGQKKKSLILAHGTCAFRTVPGGLKLTDPQAALDWARERKAKGFDIGCIIYTEKLDTSLYRKIAECQHMETNDGQFPVMPGMTNVPDRQSFSPKRMTTETEQENDDVTD